MLAPAIFQVLQWNFGGHGFLYSITLRSNVLVLLGSVKNALDKRTY